MPAQQENPLLSVLSPESTEFLISRSTVVSLPLSSCCIAPRLRTTATSCCPGWLRSLRRWQTARRLRWESWVRRGWWALCICWGRAVCRPTASFSSKDPPTGFLSPSCARRIGPPPGSLLHPPGCDSAALAHGGEERCGHSTAIRIFLSNLERAGRHLPFVRRGRRRTHRSVERRKIIPSRLLQEIIDRDAKILQLTFL